MAGLSPDDYRRAAGFRRSEAAPRPPVRVKAELAGPLVAYNTYDLNDPAVVEMMRMGNSGVTGTVVNERTALRNSTFFRSVWLICGSMGMLPIHLMQRTDAGIQKATNHPLYKVLLRRPNNYQTPSQFKGYMQLCALLDKNAFALIVRSRGRITELIPLPRRAVTPRLTDTYQMVFDYRRPSGGTVVLTQADVFHFRSPLSLDGINGIPLLDVAADTLGLAQTAQRAAGRLLSKGMMAGGSLETDTELGDEAIQQLKQSLREDYSGADNAGDWMLLEQGLKAKPFAGSAKDAQLAELRKQEAEEMSRFSGVPRPLLMFDETSWGSGIAQLGQFLVTYCLMIWFVIWEEAIWLCLLTPAEQETYYAKYNEGALLRGSLSEQAAFYSKALGMQAWMTPNEVRDDFDLNARDDGTDLPPRAGTTAAAIAEEDTTDAKPGAV